MPSVPSARSKRKWAFEEVKFSLRESEVLLRNVKLLTQ